MYGAAGYGGLGYCGAPSTSIPEFELAIDGAFRHELLDEQSLKVSHGLNARGTMSFELVDSPVAYLPDIGDSVALKTHGATVFGGTVEEIEREVIGSKLPAEGRRIKIACVDYNQLAERHYVNTVYSGGKGATLATMGANGTGYALGDILTLSGGSFTVAAQFRVTSISQEGNVAAVIVVEPGSYSATPANPAATTGGSGNGLASLFVTYEDMGKNVREIVDDIVNVQTRLWEEGVTLGEVEEGIDFAEVRFSLVTAAVAFKDLAEASGLAWRIDQHRKLHVFSRSTFAAPVVISDAARRYMTIQVNESRDEYRNKQYLKAGKTATDLRVEKFQGDGKRRTFTLSYDLRKFEDPFIDATVTNNSVKTGTPPAGTAQKLGIKGTDKDGAEGTAQWFFQREEREISQNSDESGHPALTSSQELVVRYFGEFPVVGEGQSDSEIAARKAAEGGTGVYEHREDDEELNDEDLVIEKVERLLQAKGRIKRVVPVRLQEPGLAPGQLLPIQLSDYGLDGDFLIDSVQLGILRLAPSLVWQANLQTLEGDHSQNWQEFFKEQERRGRRTSIRENEKLLVSRQFTSSMQLGPDILTEGVLEHYTRDPFSFARIVTVTRDGVSVAGWLIGRSRIGKPHGYELGADLSWLLMPEEVRARRIKRTRKVEWQPSSPAL